MRVVQELKGLHRVKRKLADGSTQTYYYAWRGGPRIDAEPGTPAFVNAFNKAHEARKQPPKGTLFGLASAFRASTDFPKSEASQKAYRSYLKLIEEEFGTMTLNAIQDPEARGIFKEWRDGMVSTPRKADYAWTVLARLLSFAKDRGKITVNVCERGGRIYDVDRKEFVWTKDHIERFAAVASDELWLALVMGLWTGQRQGDLLRLPWSAYNGRTISLKQGKNGVRVTIPVGETLRAALAATPRRAITILTTQDGTSWTSDGFRSSWGKACAKAGVDDVTFHDLRGSAVTRLAIAGCTVPEIAAITGHSLKGAQEILDAHYLGGKIELAEAAMRKREETESGTNTVKRGVNRSTRNPAK